MTDFSANVFDWGCGASLSETVSTVSACAEILLFGLPHGALDLEIIRRERGTGRAGMVALLMLYLGLAAAMASVWRSAPVAALASFLIVAVVHFAEDWPELRSTFLAQGMAIAFLTAPGLLNLTHLEQLFARLTEQAKATFEISPSMFAAFGGATLFFLGRS